MAEDIKIRNSMSLRALKASQDGAAVKFIKSPKTEKCFFECGTVQGYISKKLLANPNATTDDVGYAECYSEVHNTWIPCLFLASASNVFKTL